MEDKIIMKKINSIEALIDLDYQHISFDLWLTLIRSNPEYKYNRNILFKNYFNINFDLDVVSEKVRYYDVLCNSINERVGKNIDTFEMYLMILQSLDIDISKVDMNSLNKFYSLSVKIFFKYKPVLINKDTVEIFNILINKGVSLSLLSNTGFIKGLTLKQYFKDIKLYDYFSFQIYSDECNISKPNNKVYNLLFDEVLKFKNITKQDILHIGDNQNADYYGASQYGLNTILFKDESKL